MGGAIHLSFIHSTCAVLALSHCLSLPVSFSPLLFSTGVSVSEAWPLPQTLVPAPQKPSPTHAEPTLALTPFSLVDWSSVLCSSNSLREVQIGSS